MTVSTWEERMSQRAKARQVAAEEAERRERLARIDSLEGIALPGLPGETRNGDEEDEHFAHLFHLCGGAIRCSCGEFQGVTSYVVDGPVPPCEICAARGLT